MAPLALSLLLLAPVAEPPKTPPRTAVPWWMPHRDGEFPRMLFAIAGGSMMGPGEGWFGPSESRYGWKWLATWHGVPVDGALTPSKFRGSAASFAALDRDADGTLNADDFDWSDAAPFVRQLAQAGQWLGRADKDSDRKLTKAEWSALFTKAAGDKGHLTAEDVRALLNPPPPPRPKGPPPGMPSKETLLAGLLSGEVGSPHSGPKLGAVAPDFTLKTQDGKQTLTLSDFRGDKPVVLIFGSFT